MRTLIVVLLVLLLCVAGLGFYRGWFTLSSHKGVESNKVDISLTVDPDKVTEDAETVKEKAAEFTDKALEQARDLGDEVRDTVKSDEETEKEN